MARGNRASRGGVQVGSGRETDLRRRLGRRSQRVAILIDTNGKCTEREYFTAVKELVWAQNGRVVVVFTNGAPIDVIRDAHRRQVESDFDHAWAVCDVDQFDIAKAQSAARHTNVQVAWSNPCFEVWLILHIAAHAAHFASADQVCEKVGKILGKPWDKRAFDFSHFESGIADAVMRAKQLGAAPENNPSSDVWRVIEAMGYSA